MENRPLFSIGELVIVQSTYFPEINAINTQVLDIVSAGEILSKAEKLGRGIRDSINGCYINPADELLAGYWYALSHMPPGRFIHETSIKKIPDEHEYVTELKAMIKKTYPDTAGAQ